MIVVSEYLNLYKALIYADRIMHVPSEEVLWLKMR